MIRRGQATGTGRGYRNLRAFPRDPIVHRMSGKGLKQPQTFLDSIFMAQPDLKLAKNLDLDRYAGKWYQIAAIPVWFQKGCSNIAAEYTKRADGTIRVKNSCLRDGKPDVAYGIAKKTQTPSKLAVSFDNVPFITGDYNVLYVNPDYDYAVVGTQDRKTLWILSRKKTMPKATYQRLVALAKAQGYDTTKLRQ